MKIMQICSFNKQYLNLFYGKEQKDGDYIYLFNELYATGYKANRDWAGELSKMGWDTLKWVSNARPAINAYRKAKGMRECIMPDDELAALIMAINEYEPDVLLIDDVVRHNGAFLSRLGKKPKLTVGYVAYNFPAMDLKGYDLVISHIQGCLDRALLCGVTAVHKIYAGFPTEMYTGKKLKKAHDVVFSGQITGAHTRRNKLLEDIAGNPKASSLNLGLYLSCNGVTPQILHDANKGQVWGRDMYSAISDGYVGINAETDFAAGSPGNMRIFDITGMGGVLLTEYQNGIEEFFKVGVEIDTFTNAEELVDKALYYKNNKEAQTRMANAGMKACHNRHSHRIVTEKLDKLIKSML
jgi:hypothetical protein